MPHDKELVRAIWEALDTIATSNVGFAEAEDFITALHAAGWVLARREEVEWNPNMDEAPRDGTYILVTNKEAGAAWVARYHPVYTSGYKPENPWATVMLNHWHCDRNASLRPTAWKPLPEPKQE